MVLKANLEYIFTIVNILTYYCVNQATATRSDPESSSSASSNNIDLPVRSHRSLREVAYNCYVTGNLFMTLHWNDATKLPRKNAK